MSAIAAGAFMAASAIIKGVSANRTRKNQNTMAIEQQAIQHANMEMNKQLQQEALTKEAAEYQRVFAENQLRVEQAGQANEALNRVHAAAAGASGQSVEITANAIDAQTGRQQGELSRAQDRSLNRIDDAYRNIAVQAELGKDELVLDDQRNLAGLADLITNVARMQAGFSI